MGSGHTEGRPDEYREIPSLPPFSFYGKWVRRRSSR
jgi:hypothetical protein